MYKLVYYIKRTEGLTSKEREITEIIIKAEKA